MPSPTLKKSLAIALALVMGAVLAAFAKPHMHEVVNVADLQTSIPGVIGAWHERPDPRVQVSLNVGSDTNINQPYDQSILRTYTDDQGHTIQVALAWGKHQRQEVKIHRPELCYPAQGLAVKSLSDIDFPLITPDGQPVKGKRMLAQNRNGQLEAVSYWIRLGSTYSGSAWETRLHILKEGLAGRITDGMLVRVSQAVPKGDDLQAVYRRQESFAAQLVERSPTQARSLLVR